MRDDAISTAFNRRAVSLHAAIGRREALDVRRESRISSAADAAREV